MKVYLVKRKYIADPLCNNDKDWQASLIGRKIEQRDFNNIKLGGAKLNGYEIYENLEAAKTISDFRLNHKPDEFGRPYRPSWCAIYEIEIDSNGYVINVQCLYY